MFEKESRSSYNDLGCGSVATFPEDSTQTIYDAARSNITRRLSNDENIVTVDSLCLHEVRRIQNLCLILHEHFAVE